MNPYSALIPGILSVISPCDHPLLSDDLQMFINIKENIANSCLQITYQPFFPKNCEAEYRQLHKDNKYHRGKDYKGRRKARTTHTKMSICPVLRTQIMIECTGGFF